jgi:hypothetical protein
MNNQNQLKEANNVILKYGENNDLDSNHFLTTALFYTIIGFRLDLLANIVNSLGVFDVVKLGTCTGQKEEEDFCAAGL